MNMKTTNGKTNMVFLDCLRTITNQNAHFQRIYFKWLNPGQRVYIKPLDMGFELSLKPKDQTIERIIRSLSVTTGTSAVLNTWNILDKNCAFVSVFQESEDNYFVRPSSEEEIEKYSLKKKQLKLGEVGKFGVGLGKYKNYVFSKKDVQVTAVTSNGIYFKLLPVDHTDLPLKGEVCANNGTNYVLKLKDFQYKLNSMELGTKTFSLPLTFLREKMIQRGDVLPVWKNREGEVVIEAVPGHCAVCGAEIRRYGKNGEVIQTCDHCHSLLPEVKEELAQSKADQLLMKIEERMGIVQENVKLCQTLINKIKTLKLD